MFYTLEHLLFSYPNFAVAGVKTLTEGEATSVIKAYRRKETL